MKRLKLKFVFLHWSLGDPYAFLPARPAVALGPFRHATIWSPPAVVIVCEKQSKCLRNKFTWLKYVELATKVANTDPLPLFIPYLCRLVWLTNPESVLSRLRRQFLHMYGVGSLVRLPGGRDGQKSWSFLLVAKAFGCCSYWLLAVLNSLFVAWKTAICAKIMKRDFGQTQSALGWVFMHSN